MKKQKLKGAWNEAVGETKEHLGRAIGNKDLERRGHEQEMKGKLQKAASDVSESVSDAAKRLNPLK